MAPKVCAFSDCSRIRLVFHDQSNRYIHKNGVTTKLFADNSVNDISGDNELTVAENNNIYNGKMVNFSSFQTSINLCTMPKLQRRPNRRPRKPRNYWSDIENLRREILQFWIVDANVSLNIDEPLPVPSETLLTHFQRFDLRNGINVHGGRSSIVERLGGSERATLVPGKWSEAVKTCSAVQQLVNENNNHDLSPMIPPISPQTQQKLEQKERMNSEAFAKKNEMKFERFNGGVRWAHKKKRNPKGYWTEERVIEQLYEYLEHVKSKTGRPSVWMPRPSEISAAGRDDLKQAISRFGGATHICERAGLIPYNEWRYFENQLELYMELDNYLRLYHNNTRTDFPRVGEILQNGNERLYDLVMNFGGGKLVACKLDMRYAAETSVTLFQGISFGRFSLDFAVKLLQFVRLGVMEQSPPLQNPMLRMPSVADLIRANQKQIAIDVMSFGGPENVARRLGLDFSTIKTDRKSVV